jgi:DNA-directed RNA polymerase subunit omega
MSEPREVVVIEKRPTLVDPPIEALLAKVGGSKFALVTVASVRAREINEYRNGLGQGHGVLIPPQVRSLSNKSLSVALEELYQDRLVYHRPSAEELEAERVVAEELALAAEVAATASELDIFTEALRDA